MEGRKGSEEDGEEGEEEKGEEGEEGKGRDVNEGERGQEVMEIRTDTRESESTLTNIVDELVVMEVEKAHEDKEESTVTASWHSTTRRPL